MGKIEKNTLAGSFTVGRRRFTVMAGLGLGGLTVGIVPTFEALAAPSVSNTPWGDAPSQAAVELSPWLTIAADDTVTVRVASPDIGNGVMTQIAMNVTEELQNDWSKIRAEYAPPQRDFAEGSPYSVGNPLSYFSGRSTGESRMKLMLQVGASARERLKAAAAQEWNVPVAEIDAKNSVLTHKPTGRTLRYGEVAQKAAAIKLDKEPDLKPQSEWTFLGKASPAKLQLANIVNGQAVFGMDIRLPGMLYAALMQSPVHGGKLKSYDFDAIKNMPGVRGVAVVDPSEQRKMARELKAPFPLGASAAQSAIAVIADHYWQARKALDALPIEWDDGVGAQWKTTEQIYVAAHKALEKEGEQVEATRGQAYDLIGKQKKVVEASYTTPYCDHMNMEPLNGTALVTADKVELWMPSQHPQQAVFIAAEEPGVEPEKIFVHQTFVGGGFGRRVYGDDARMVLAVAKKFPGTPIHVIWSREESMRQGRYRAMMAAKLRAGLDESGMPSVLIARASGRGMSLNGLANSAYTSGIIPNVQVESQTMPLHILTGPYRGPGYNSNAFFLETFIDECAYAAGIDPMEYRLKLFAKWPDAGWTKCLQDVKAKSGWGKKLPRGQGMGVAISNWGMAGKPEAGTTVACVATVEVSKNGNLTIHAVDVSFDTGRIVNRDAIAAGIEGGTIFGLNMTLNEGLDVRNGRIVDGNYDQYPMLRMGDMPKKINVSFDGLSNHDRFSEIGEPPVGPVGPAIGNAIFAATGKRLRTTPFRLHDLSWA